MKIPVDECPAGPAMDAAADSLFSDCKHTLSRILFQGKCDKLAYVCSKCRKWFEDGKNFGWSYSTDIAAAWELAEKCKHGRFGVGWSEDWGVPYCILGDIHVYADAAPLAICRAFLKTNGIEYVEVSDENTC